MALEKTLATSKGIDCSYWRIAGKPISIDERNKVIEVALYGYVDADSTDANEPIATKLYTLSGDNFIEPADRVSATDARDWVYPAIKAMTTTDEDGNVVDSEFKDATEV